MQNFTRATTSSFFAAVNQGNNNILTQSTNGPGAGQIGALSSPLRGKLTLERLLPATTTTYFNPGTTTSPFFVTAKQGKEKAILQSTNGPHTGQIDALSSPVRRTLALGRLLPATSTKQASQTGTYQRYSITLQNLLLLQSTCVQLYAHVK